jgi:hypothetical protein
VINQKPDFDKSERGQTEPNQTTTKMKIKSGETLSKREREGEREGERERERERMRE